MDRPRRGDDPARRRRPSRGRELPSAATGITGRSTVVDRAGSARRHCSTSSSAEANCRAKTNSTSGRSTASSVSGHRVVGERAVDHRRRDEHHMFRSARVGGGERGRGEPRRALALGGPCVVVTAAEVDDDVGPRRRHRAVDCERQRVDIDRLHVDVVRIELAHHPFTERTRRTRQHHARTQQRFGDGCHRRHATRRSVATIDGSRPSDCSRRAAPGLVPMTRLKARLNAASDS